MGTWRRECHNSTPAQVPIVGNSAIVFARIPAISPQRSVPETALHRTAVDDPIGGQKPGRNPCASAATPKRHESFTRDDIDPTSIPPGLAPVAGGATDFGHIPTGSFTPSVTVGTANVPHALIRCPTGIEVLPTTRAAACAAFSVGRYRVVSLRDRALSI